MKLWISTGYNEHGLAAVVADTREEAIAKANAKLSLEGVGARGGVYVPYERYKQSLLENLDGMREVEDGVFIDWDAARQRR